MLICILNLVIYGIKLCFNECKKQIIQFLEKSFCFGFVDLHFFKKVFS